MTTRGVQDPIAIHFLIDGQHGILEARDIAASMHFPPILEDLGSFRHWSQYSEPDMVSTLSGDITRADPHTIEPSSSRPTPVTCTRYSHTTVTPSPPMPIRALMSSFHSLSASRATLVREMQAIDDNWIPY
ncbi:hypothetical protein AAG906_007794 [Vitis piasezkii]